MDQDLAELLLAAVILRRLLSMGEASAQTTQAVAMQDYQIDALDPGIKLFVREKIPATDARFTDWNIVVFLHGATSPSTGDFDLQYKDYSWADWMVKRGFVVYMVDHRNYGGSTREKAMDEPAANNKTGDALLSGAARH